MGFKSQGKSKKGARTDKWTDMERLGHDEKSERGQQVMDGESVGDGGRGRRRRRSRFCIWDTKNTPKAKHKHYALMMHNKSL